MKLLLSETMSYYSIVYLIIILLLNVSTATSLLVISVLPAHFTPIPKYYFKIYTFHL